VKIIITGATGFVGRSLLPKLFESHETAIVVRHKKKAMEMFPNQNVKIIDINDPDYKSEIRAFNATVLVHLATFLNSKERSDVNIHEFVDANILFGTQILNSMVGTDISYVINVGTCLEYRNNSTLPYSSDLYSATKTAFRSVIAYYQNLIGFKWINVIPFSIYGHGAPKIVLDYICESLISTESVNFTQGNQIIDLIHIDDVTRFFEVLINNTDKIIDSYSEFEIGTSQGISIKELVSVFEKKANKKANIIWGGLNYSELASMYNVARTEKSYDLWKPEYKLDQAVTEYLTKHKIDSTFENV